MIVGDDDERASLVLRVSWQVREKAQLLVSISHYNTTVADSKCSARCLVN